MVPAPSPVLIRDGLITEEDLHPKDEPVKGIGKYIILSRLLALIWDVEYVRARVKDVHHRSNTRIERGPESVFKVKNLEVPDLYV